MTQANELLSQLEQLSGDPTEAAAQAIQIHHFARDAKKAHSVDWDAVQKKAKAVITDIMIEFGVDRITTQAGRAYVPAAGVTIGYDAKALDALCASNPKLKKKIWPHRKERQRVGSLTIR